MKTEPVETPTTAEIPLSPEEADLFLEIESDIKQMQLQANALLRVILRRHKAQGDWKLMGDKLVRI